MKLPITVLLVGLTVLSSAMAAGPNLPPGCSEQRDIVYATRDPGGPQKLDLYLPAGKGPFPWIVRIHGGAWRAGDKVGGVPLFLLEAGYAIASVEYRFTNVAPFPAQIQDCKAAVRYLREHAAEFNLDPDRAGAMGDSAGGHLASLLGLAPRVAALTDAPDFKTSEAVKAVVDFYGPSDLRVPHDDKWNAAHPDLRTAVEDLLGGPRDQKADVAKAASPITYVTKTAPPFLILQGDADDTVLPVQSITLDRALRAAGVPGELILLPGAGHGGAAFGAPEQQAKIVAFLNRYLR